MSDRYTTVIAHDAADFERYLNHYAAKGYTVIGSQVFHDAERRRFTYVALMELTAPPEPDE